MNTVEGHPIQVVVRRTGLSPHVIRMWEKRYAAVEPQRTPTNRRRYSDADIQRLILLCRATRAGRSIGQIAHLPSDQLLELVTTDEGLTAPASPHNPTTDLATPQAYFETCLTAVGQLDATELETVLMRARIALSQPLLLEQVIAPMMDEIGLRWRDGSLRIMHEHLASSVVRAFLGNLARDSQAAPTAPNLIVTTPVGHVHEIGALMAACTAAAEGWNVTYLGAELPVEEIAAAAQTKHAKAVALSIAYPEDDPHLESNLSQLRRYLPVEMALLIGGRAAHAYRPLLEKLNISSPADLAHLRHELETLRVGTLGGVKV